jgi:DNA-binding transcriptional regulator YhcF (GntR family)
MEVYFTVVRDDQPQYYMRRSQWTHAPHLAAMLTEDVATKIAKRYGCRIEKDSGYQIQFRSFADLGEPESPALIEAAIRTAKKDGLSNDEILAIVSKVLEN